jgi:hypothetical protein
VKGDAEIPFEEVLEKAKAGDPKAQTEVRTQRLVGKLRVRSQHMQPGQMPAAYQESVPCKQGQKLAWLCHSCVLASLLVWFGFHVPFYRQTDRQTHTHTHTHTQFCFLQLSAAS